MPRVVIDVGVGQRADRMQTAEQRGRQRHVAQRVVQLAIPQGADLPQPRQ